MRIESPPDSGYPGIALRQLEKADIPAWYEYLSMPEVVEHTSWNLHSAADLVPMLDAYESSAPTSMRRLAMLDEEHGRVIGTIGFHTISDLNRSAEIAYDLAPAYWGRGIASAVCAAVTSWAFAHEGRLRVQGVVLETNLRSDKVLTKCGYCYEGLLRAYRMVRGTPGNFRMYARLSGDMSCNLSGNMNDASGAPTR
jgi:[ribosomal protein S5]-alanine N-acetyltransferase